MNPRSRDELKYLCIHLKVHSNFLSRNILVYFTFINDDTHTTVFRTLIDEKRVLTQNLILNLNFENVTMKNFIKNNYLLFRDVEIGDIVTIGECRPLSKTIRFNVLKVSKGKGSKKSFKKF